MDTKAFIELEKKVGAHNYAPLPVVLDHGKGVWLWDIEGKKYLDLMSAYSAVSFGHCHPRIVAAMTDQINTLCVTSRAFHNNRLMPFLEKLCNMANLDMALPMNSGAEAVETAIKAVRKWGYEKKSIPDNKAEIIVAEQNFHGRTTTITGFSSEPSYKRHFGPFTPGFVKIPFGDMAALRKAITPNTCAVLFETIQGESGIHLGPNGWLKECRKICDENNVLMVLDEIQCGLGRTGKVFAFEHEGVQPDGVIVGKALGGGVLAVSAFVATRTVMDVYTPGIHGSTFGGNALAARVGLEALTILEEEHLVERSRELGEVLMTSLKKIKSPLIHDIRGKGLWVGVEIVSKVPASKVCYELMKKGVLTKEAHDTVIRFAPPLIIEKADILWGIEQFEAALAVLSNHSDFVQST